MDRFSTPNVEKGSIKSNGDCNDFQRCKVCTWGFFVNYNHPRELAECPRCSNVQKVQG